MNRRYRLWKYIQSAIALTITVFLLKGPDPGRIIYSVLVMHTWMLILLLPFPRESAKPLSLSSRLANMVSALRGPGSALLLFIPPSMLPPLLPSRLRRKRHQPGDGIFHHTPLRIQASFSAPRTGHAALLIFMGAEAAP
jgi:hypothetical protein